MDLTSLLKRAEAPEQEKPQLSKEEYAAQKKAEREALWERVDTQVSEVFQDGASLKGFLDFMAQCNPQRTANLLLLYEQNPEITWAKSFDGWKAEGRSVRGGETGYTALLGQEYTKEDGRVASGYTIGKMFDISQTRGRQPEEPPLYAEDELLTALFTSSPVRLSVADNLPDKVQAQYVPKHRTIYVRNNMDAGTTFRAVAREQASASFDLHNGRFNRNAYGAQSFCAAYVVSQKYGINVGMFNFDKVCEVCAPLAPEDKRRFLSDVKSAAYTVERVIDTGLQNLEEVREDAEYSVESSAPEEKTSKTVKGKKAPQQTEHSV